LLVFLTVVGALVFLLVLWPAGPAMPVSTVPSPEPLLPPHAMFAGGHRYATERELGIIGSAAGGSAAGGSVAGGSDTDGLGEGLLLALVDALRLRGVTSTNPIEPEDHGFMTVVDIDGDDVILQIGVGGDRQWLLLVRSPSGTVPSVVMDALASLDDVRDIAWFGI
jgi:hypothetical protein